MFIIDVSFIISYSGSIASLVVNIGVRLPPYAVAADLHSINFMDSKTILFMLALTAVDMYVQNFLFIGT